MVTPTWLCHAWHVAHCLFGCGRLPHMAWHVTGRFTYTMPRTTILLNIKSKMWKSQRLQDIRFQLQSTDLCIAAPSPYPQNMGCNTSWCGMSRGLGGGGGGSWRPTVRQVTTGLYRYRIYTIASSPQDIKLGRDAGDSTVEKTAKI